MLAICSDDAIDKEDNMEAFLLEVACELIGTTEETRGVRVVKRVPAEEEGNEEEKE